MMGTTLEQIAEMLCGPCKEQWHPLDCVWGKRYRAPGLTITLEGGTEASDGYFDFQFKDSDMIGRLPVRCLDLEPNVGWLAHVLLDMAANFLSKMKC